MEMQMQMEMRMEMEVEVEVEIQGVPGGTQPAITFHPVSWVLLLPRERYVAHQVLCVSFDAQGKHITWCTAVRSEISRVVGKCWWMRWSARSLKASADYGSTWSKGRVSSPGATHTFD